MQNEAILEKYEVFLMKFMENPHHKVADYSRLMDCLFNIPFYAFVKMDNNRIEDAIYMRNEYLSSDNLRGINTSIIKDRYISVLEVLIALAKRMENDILCDPMEEIDHSSDHFWLFIRNLGLENMTNIAFDGDFIREKVTKWVHREFNKD